MTVFSFVLKGCCDNADAAYANHAKNQAIDYVDVGNQRVNVFKEVKSSCTLRLLLHSLTSTNFVIILFI